MREDLCFALACRAQLIDGISIALRFMLSPLADPYRGVGASDLSELHLHSARLQCLFHVLTQQVMS